MFDALSHCFNTEKITHQRKGSVIFLFFQIHCVIMRQFPWFPAIFVEVKFWMNWCFSKCFVSVWIYIFITLFQMVNEYRKFFSKFWVIVNNKLFIHSPHYNISHTKTALENLFSLLCVVFPSFPLSFLLKFVKEFLR